MKKPRMILVEWWDASMAAGWETSEHYAEKSGVDLNCSVGYVNVSDEKQIQLVQTIGAQRTDKDVGGSVSIPRGCVVRVRRLGVLASRKAKGKRSKAGQ